MSMPPDLDKLTEVLERQLGLLHDLAGELTTCRPAFAAMDLEGIYLHIKRQTEICEKLRDVEEVRMIAWNDACASLNLPSIDGNLRGWIADLEGEDAARFRGLLTELAIAEGEVRHQNRMHINLVDGSRRTLDILDNALAAFSPSYILPHTVQAIVKNRGLA